MSELVKTRLLLYENAQLYVVNCVVLCGRKGRVRNIVIMTIYISVTYLKSKKKTNLRIYIVCVHHILLLPHEIVVIKHNEVAYTEFL